MEILDISMKLLVILLCINAALLAAETAGIYKTTGLGELTTKVTELKELAQETMQDANVSVDAEKQETTALDLLGIIFGTISTVFTMLRGIAEILFKGLFGYVLLIQQIFPQEVSWLAILIATPLAFLQVVAIILFIAEIVYKVKL